MLGATYNQILTISGKAFEEAQNIPCATVQGLSACMDIANVFPVYYKEL